MADNAEPKYPGDQCPPDCRYAMRISSAGDGHIHRHCGFILKTDQMRGCEVGPGCTRYCSGEPSKPQAMTIKDGKPRRRRRGGGMKPTWDTIEGYRMHCKGATSREIAQAVGIAMRTVQSYRQRYWNRGLLGPGIPVRRDHDG